MDSIITFDRELSSGVFVAGDTIDVSVRLDPYFDERYRSIRVELESFGSAEANGRSNHGEQPPNHLLYTYDDIQKPYFQIQIPELPNNICNGVNFVIEHSFKLILDKPMSSDINVNIPVIYFNQEPRPIDGPVMKTEPCSKCGTEVSSDGLFCPECGNKTQ